MFNKNIFKSKDSVAEAITKVIESSHKSKMEELKGNQKVLDKNKNNKLDAQDFAILRGEKKAMKEEEEVEESTNPFSKDYKSQMTTKPGEKAGFDSKKISTGTVYSRKHKPEDTKDDDKMKKEEVELDEASYSAKAARAGKDIGKPGKMFAKIAASAGKKYGSKERGEKVAGAVLKKLRMKENTEFSGKLIEGISMFSEAQLDEMINEVLGKDAKAGDWIHDFVHSKNPKFDGKSKAKRKEMALAAYYAKQRNEEVEPMDESVKTTHENPLVTVHDKDGLVTHAHLSTANDLHGTNVKHTDVHKGSVKAKSREGGDLKFAISMHHAKAMKDEGEFKKQFGEEDEHLDEWIKPKTLPRSGSRFKSMELSRELRREPHHVLPGETPQAYEKRMAAKKNMKMNKEEVEQLDEIGDTAKGKAALRAVSARADKTVSDWNKKPESGFSPTPKNVAKRFSASIAASQRLHGFGPNKLKKDTVTARSAFREELGMEEVERVEEWIDPNVQTVDTLKGREKVKKDDPLGKGGDFKSAKVKFLPDPVDVDEGKRPESDTVPFVTNENKPLERVKEMARASLKKMRSEMMGKAGTSE